MHTKHSVIFYNDFYRAKILKTLIIFLQQIFSMNKTVSIQTTILIIVAIIFSGCTSISSLPVQSPTSVTTDTKFDHLLLSSADLPEGLVRAGDGPMPASDFTEPMRRFDVQGAHRALYADVIPLSDKSNVMEQNILIFNGVNASAMLKEYNNSFNAKKSNRYTPLYLPNPNIGENSFAVKVTTISPSGAEINNYVIGFVKSGIFEVFSMQGTPETYQSFLKVAELAADKIL